MLIYSHSSTNRENLEKIGRVDFEITGLTEIVENIKQQQNMQPAGQRPGGINNTVLLAVREESTGDPNFSPVARSLTCGHEFD